MHVTQGFKKKAYIFHIVKYNTRMTTWKIQENSRDTATSITETMTKPYGQNVSCQTQTLILFCGDQYSWDSPPLFVHLVEAIKLCIFNHNGFHHIKSAMQIYS